MLATSEKSHLDENKPHLLRVWMIIYFTAFSVIWKNRSCEKN